MGSIPAEKDYDVVVVGAGFSGLYLLDKFRKLGYSVILLEAGAKAGGIWYWNCYPGSRVDTEVPQYQYTSDETWTTWEWKQRFPCREELLDYFQHVVQAWGLKDDIKFHTRVTSAHWDQKALQWALKTQGDEDTRYRSRFLCLCTGFASKPYTPPFKGLEAFRGTIYHTSHWPQQGVSLHNKRVGVIGTGASGVQAIQEISKEASHLTVFQRTPNTAIPMTNPSIDTARNQYFKDNIPEWRQKQATTFAGFTYEFLTQKAADATLEERSAVYEELWNTGGLNFWLGNYSDMLENKEVNDTAYQFWRGKAIKRINDPRKAEILAPEVPIHPFGTKRISLEQNYFETFNRPNVDLVNLRETPIAELVPEGIKTTDGQIHVMDVLVMATGFDSITGGITQIDLRGVSGQHITKKWADGVYTYLGMTVSDFPNMFYVYGPQAPTAFATGPISAETQGAWIVKCVQYMMENGLISINATEDAEKQWKAHVNEAGGRGLFPHAQSWYYGDNIPGKPREALNYMAGMPAYKERCWDCAKNGYKGFEIH